MLCYAQVAGMNILQAKIGALEKELDAERTTAVTLQSKFSTFPKY